MSKKVIILTSNSPYEKSGRTNVDLKKALELHGIEAAILSDKYFKSNDQKIISLVSKLQYYNQKIFNRLKKILGLRKETTNKDYYMFSYKSHLIEYKTSKIINKFPFKPDAIIYVFCRDFLNEKHLHEIYQETGALIVRFMADNQELTGGCHFFWDCKGFENSCGSCPGLFSYKDDDITRTNFLLKQKFINKMNTVAIGGSQWQYNKLKTSALYKNKKYYKILNPTDDDFFKSSKDKESLIKKYNLPTQNNVKFVLFGSIDNSEKRKGGKELFLTLKALKEVNANNIHLLVIGNNLNKDIVNLGFNYTNLGYVPFNKLVEAYQIANVYVSPSIEDAGPTMINQSLMCGTPVACFNMGVSSDLVLNGVSGYAVELGNYIELANAIRDITRSNKKDELLFSKRSREIALEKCSLKVIGEKFKNCIEENI